MGGYLQSLQQKPKEAPISQMNGIHVTSNVAEYAALIDALEWLQTERDKSAFWVEIFGDSKLVVEQVNRRWKAHKAHLTVLRDKVHLLLEGFAGWGLSWHPRKHNVLRFGH